MSDHRNRCPECGGRMRIERASWGIPFRICACGHVDAADLYLPAAAQFSPAHSSPSSRSSSPKPRPSEIEEMLALQIAEAGLPAPVRELRWLPGRRYRADFAWPDRRLLVEVEGMVHRIEGRWRADVVKNNAAVLSGWRMLRVTGRMIRSGDAVSLIRAALATIAPPEAPPNEETSR